MELDMNWWGVVAVPIGVALCFGPVLVAWAMAERKSKSEPQPQSRPERKDKR